MGIADNEMLDRALDAAEAQLSGDTVETEAPVEEKPELDEVSEQAATKEALDKGAKDRERDERGKFKKAEKPAPKQILDQNANAVEQEAEPAKDAEVVEETSSDEPPIELPAFWSADEKTAVAKGASREVQQIIARKEQQRIEWANRVANESERGKAIEKRSKEVFEPYRLKLQAQGIQDPLEAASRLLAWNELFESNPKAALADLMRKNGLTPADFSEDADQNNQYPMDPRVEEAVTAANEAKRLAEEWKTKLEQQEQKSFVGKIETFKNGTDSLGNVRRSFAEMYAPQIEQAAQSIQKIHPDMPLEEVLNLSYEFVLDETRKLHGVAAPKPSTVAEKKPEEVIQQAKKAQAAASSVTGAPASGTSVSTPRLKGKNFGEKIDAAFSLASEVSGY